MDKEKYMALLDKGYEDMPETTRSTERWEIPKADIEYEGKTTVIKNWKYIMDELNRDEKRLFKKMCKELGVAGDIKSSSGRAILKSIVKRHSLNNFIKKYCQDYVICPTCSKPDTIITKDGRNHVLVCQACGTRRIIKL
ncbi:MAG: translation initiation factor IF-2 subunit beta [Candidatus Lokiarchaeota archaeon]|nr:translation initiation factor IF-2 subunit beta [Candidatus Lokiarchaeota archaeon]